MKVSICKTRTKKEYRCHSGFEAQTFTELKEGTCTQKIVLAGCFATVCHKVVGMDDIRSYLLSGRCNRISS